MVRIFLLLNTVFFIGFGLFVFFDPHQLANNMGAGNISSNGIYELRSNYGGVSFGAGLLCLAGFLKYSLQRPALFFLFAYTGGYALGRIAALPLDGIPSPRLLFFAAFEIVTALIAMLLLFRASSAR